MTSEFLDALIRCFKGHLRWCGIVSTLALALVSVGASDAFGQSGVYNTHLIAVVLSANTHKLAEVRDVRDFGSAASCKSSVETQGSPFIADFTRNAIAQGQRHIFLSYRSYVLDTGFDKQLWYLGCGEVMDGSARNNPLLKSMSDSYSLKSLHISLNALAQTGNSAMSADRWVTDNSDNPNAQTSPRASSASRSNGSESGPSTRQVANTNGETVANQVSGSVPNMEVSVRNQVMTVTSSDDGAFTIQRIVFNNRERQDGCDYSAQNTNLANIRANPANPMAELGQAENEMPVTLRMGDVMQFVSGCGGAIMTVSIYTDRGTYHHRFSRLEKVL